MKILIVGAGPIGCYTARLLKEKNSNFDITIIEEHAEIGRPVHCAGLVSRDVLTQMKVPISNDIIINYIDGADFFLNRDSFKLIRKEVAIVIDREKFDRSLGNGLEVNFNTRFMGIEKENSGYLVETDKGEYYADIVIGADGANSLVRKAVGFNEDIEYLRGVQFRMKYNKCDKNSVQVHLKNPFFAWVIPENEQIVRVGIISSHPYHDLTHFLQETEIKGDVLEKFAGIVPLGTCQSQNGNVILVGDAACQVKPLTQGGIYYGMRCVEILVDCIINDRLCDYEKNWKTRFNKEIQIGLKIRRLYESLGKDNLSKIFSLLKRNKGIIEKFGDFENHSKVIFALLDNLRSPTFLKKILLDIIRHNQRY
jgi:geranylgeranyl reductase family protein